MALLLVYLFTALFVSFICSIMEAVLLSVPISFLKASAAGGKKSHLKFIKYKEDLDKPLSAILSLNTIAHTVGAAGVGAQATIVFGEAYFGLVSAVLTILILVLTEIIPKTLGASYSKELVTSASSTIGVMIFITYPLVVISAFITKLLSKNTNDFTTSREEISALAHIGLEEGIFADKENKIIQNLIQLRHVKVSEIITPRVVVVIASEEMTLQEFFLNKDFLRFSRIPVYRENRDNITGYVFRAAIFEKLAEDRFDLKLKDLKREIVTLAESTTLDVAWETLLSNREHIALIVDEYGGMDGIATLEDVIETLLGFDIVDEKDQVENMKDFAMQKWKNKQKSIKKPDNDFS